LALLGSPVSLSGVLAIEALSQAVRHIAFGVPAGIGVQDVAVVVLAQSIGVQLDITLSLALVKRAREILFGVTALISWQAMGIIRERSADTVMPCHVKTILPSGQSAASASRGVLDKQAPLKKPRE